MSVSKREEQLEWALKELVDDYLWMTSPENRTRPALRSGVNYAIDLLKGAIEENVSGTEEQYRGAGT